MYVQATVFRDRTPKMPGGAQIHWQGLGEDAGHVVIHGDAGDGDDWYIVDGIGGLLDLSAGPAHTETLHPVLHWPDPWWMGPAWCAYPDNLVQPQSWTSVKTQLTNWLPREWQYDWLPTSAQGTTNASELSSNWYGDEWYSGQTPRGVLKRAGSGTNAMWDYHWDDVWVHNGRGSAPAGEYIRLDGGDGKLNVGYYDYVANLYKLNPPNAGPSMANVDMVQLGELRKPPIDPTDPLAQLVPSGWDFEGANWEDPDPYDWRYWYCIRAACLERESVVGCGIAHEMGSIIGNEERIWGLSPWCPPSLDGIRALRELIARLSQEYVDIGSVVTLLLDGKLPSLDATQIGLDEYNSIPGGWVGSDPLVYDTYGAPGSFLADAYTVLRKMTVTVPSRTFYHRIWNGGVAYGEGESMFGAWSDAMDAYNHDTTKWEHWTESRGADIWWALTSHIVGRSGAERDVSDPSNALYIAAFQIWQTSLRSVCAPTTSVIDGRPISPKPIYVWDSHKQPYEPGDPYYGGIVVRNSYYSASQALYEGVHAGMAEFPADFLEAPPGAYPTVAPPSPDDEQSSNWHVWGNETVWYIYLFWGDSFRFGGPSPVEEPDPDEPDEP